MFISKEWWVEWEIEVEIEVEYIAANEIEIEGKNTETNMKTIHWLNKAVRMTEMGNFSSNMFQAMK